MIPSLVSCPECHAPVEAGESAWTCRGCGRLYPAVLGIPDFRPEGAPPSEPRVVADLVAAYDGATFQELVALRTQVMSAVAPHLRERYESYRRGMRERGQRFDAMFRGRLGERFPGLPHPGVAVDLGCGSGASTLALAPAFAQVVAVDPSLADLLLARKALEEASIGHVTLVQGYAQRLPLAGESVDYLCAQNVLEHVMDLEGTLAEVARVLLPGGAFAGDSRNRYDLLLKEPPVRIRWVGYVPRRWQRRYVQWRCKHPYKNVQLLSYGELRAALCRHLGPRSELVFPWLSVYGAPRWTETWALRLERHAPGLARVLLRVFPSHLALGVKDKV